MRQRAGKYRDAKPRDDALHDSPHATCPTPLEHGNAMRTRSPQDNAPSRGRDGILADTRSSSRAFRHSDPGKIEQCLVPIRSFIDDQMVDNILVVLKIELAAANGGRDPSDDEIAQFLRERKPARLLRTIRAHSTMRGLESLTKSDHQVLRWCAMLARAL
jgi:hypothetical protein